jgi:hypothetical protein
MKDPYDQGRNKEPNPRSGQAQAPEVDPILALRGVGKELWRDLGGGENFIRELRGKLVRSESHRPKICRWCTRKEKVRAIRLSSLTSFIYTASVGLR